MRYLAGSLAATLIAGSALAAAAPATLNGKALYHEKCYMCHGPGGMGTGLLERRVHPALLTQRTDLTTVRVIAVVRSGLGNMPPLSRGEVSDQQLAAIAAYLAGPKAHR